MERKYREIKMSLNNVTELFSTNVGSHMWKMNHENSDIDVCTVYLQDSKEFILGNRPKGKQTQEGDYDYTYYELGLFIKNLIKGNVNYLWGIMSPIVIGKYKSAFEELRQIVSTNLAKNCYHSVNGLAKHNIYHFINGGDKYSAKYKKKLNVIGRTLKFGINILTWGKCMFEKVNIENDEELYVLKESLNKAYMYSSLPETPNPEPFEKYLIKWRIHKMKLDGLI